MEKIILGLVAAATVATTIALTAGSASADTILSTAPGCSPVKEAAAYTETFYKYRPVVNGTGPIHWATSEQGTNITVHGVAYVRDGVKTESVFHEAVQGVNCGVTLPQFDTTTVAYTPLANVTSCRSPRRRDLPVRRSGLRPQRPDHRGRQRRPHRGVAVLGQVRA
jgi:hypothetical protein